MTDPTLRAASPARRISVVKSGEFGEVARETRPAIFLDRDGTIIEDTGYVRAPDAVRLLPGAAMALRLAHNVQRPVVVVTNQSGIARGLLTEADYQAVRARVGELLSEYGAFVDAEYACPHHPDFTGPCACRKPGTELFERAALEHGLDLAASAYIGDRWRDVAPALAFGGLGVLVPGPQTPPDEIETARLQARIAPTLTAAIELALGGGAA